MLHAIKIKTTKIHTYRDNDRAIIVLECDCGCLHVLDSVTIPDYKEIKELDPLQIQTPDQPMSPDQDGGT